MNFLFPRELLMKKKFFFVENVKKHKYFLRINN